MSYLDKVDVIPEAVQAPMRERLRELRVSKDARQDQLPYITRNTAKKWEGRDISGMKLVDLYNVSQFMGWDMARTVMYVMTGETLEELPDYDPSEQREPDYIFDLIRRGQNEATQTGKK